MGLLDCIFGKDPEWVEVTKDTFSIEDTYIYSKAESKKLLKLYLFERMPIILLKGLVRSPRRLFRE